MLAGVGGMDLVLLIVAADEGVQQQTREHLAILDLLGVEKGIIVLTKSDLVDNEWIELIETEIEEWLITSSLNGSPIARCSALTEDGLPELIELLSEATNTLTPQTDLGKPRLWIDRSFTISGFGSVATGTLLGGTIKIGQEVEIIPTQQRGRIRGLQTHNRNIKKAIPGSRVAVNISGLSHDDISRGSILTIPGWLKATSVIDATIRMAESTDRKLKHNALINFYSGTAETTARIRLLEADALSPGEIGWAQLRLEDPLPILEGDLFILRTGDTTLAGGVILETNPKRHRKSDRSVLERLQLISTGSPGEIALIHLQEKGPLDHAALFALMDCTSDTLLDAMQLLTTSQEVIAIIQDNKRQEACYIDTITWESSASTLEHLVQQYHNIHPLRRGISKEEVRTRLGWHTRVFTRLIEQMCEKCILSDAGDLVSAIDHVPMPSPEQEKDMLNYIVELQRGRFSPPTNNHLNPDLLSLLIDRGEVVKLNEEVVLTASVYEEMLTTTVTYMRAQGSVTVGEARDLFATSRKYVLAFLEHLDKLQVTRRSGEGRVLIRTTD
jgi:selenocysteine-specific elongation factor